MADERTKQRVAEALKLAYFNDPGDLVDVSDGLDDNIHVVVVSRKFDGHRLREKNDMIWSVLIKELTPEEWGLVTLSVGVSPEELKAAMV